MQLGFSLPLATDSHHYHPTSAIISPTSPSSENIRLLQTIFFFIRKYPSSSNHLLLHREIIIFFTRNHRLLNSEIIVFFKSPSSSPGNRLLHPEIIVFFIRKSSSSMTLIEVFLNFSSQLYVSRLNGFDEVEDGFDDVEDGFDDV
ncbi:hypothetical protein L6452_41884 [Arctium lappa]|uniref:Uncharacterized protein n=1 Tax=Arctium lappa TaxID=4217 RepID=A0ACB8XHW6_ARCLA|nr:hypothetical protein L6452_41884 [Arctium lappa]